MKLLLFISFSKTIYDFKQHLSKAFNWPSWIKRTGLFGNIFSLYSCEDQTHGDLETRGDVGWLYVSSNTTRDICRANDNKTQRSG